MMIKIFPGFAGVSTLVTAVVSVLTVVSSVFVSSPLQDEKKREPAIKVTADKNLNCFIVLRFLKMNNKGIKHRSG